MTPPCGFVNASIVGNSLNQHVSFDNSIFCASNYKSCRSKSYIQQNNEQCKSQPQKIVVVACIINVFITSFTGCCRCGRSSFDCML